MLVGIEIEELKQNSYRKKIITLIACILAFSIGIYVFRFGMLSEDTAKNSQTKVPLLLNSGAVLTKEAEVSLIIWSENGDIPLEIWTKGPLPDWSWDYKELQTESGKTAVTLSGHRPIDKNEESKLYSWYTIMAQELSKTGGRIYLDERVPQAIDISAYLSQTNALPAQWALMGNLLSIAAYQNNFKTSVMAGQDRINIQLLCRGEKTAGQTVLAIPALLEEF
ncbi:MAG: hypothetical protein P4L49_05560 [Desulfosporosinus sp.]|nr:hypothetical protein [Desulfosporosinus sp.]